MIGLAGTTAVTAATGCPGLQALNPVCQVVTTVGGIGGSVAASGVDAVLGGLSQWVASGAEWLLSQIGAVLTSTTTIDIGASWFRQHYGEMTALAGVVILPLLVVSTLQAVYRQNAGQLLRSFFVQLPLALLLGVVAIQIVILCLSATDALCTAVAGGSGSDVDALLNGLTKGLVVAVGDPTMATFVLLLVGLLVAAAAFVLWLELLIRAAAVYVAVLFLPMALATLVWPSVSHWCRRLVETLAALILSKFIIVATLSLAAGAVASGTAGTGDHGSGFASVLAGGALLVLATFVPFAILRLIPLAEAGAIGQLDGMRQRATAPLTGMPKSAAAFAMREGWAAHGAAKGAAKVASGAGPVGTGLRSDQSVDTAAPRTDEHGEAIASLDGLIRDARGDERMDARVDRITNHPRDKGPKPILRPSGSRGMAGAGSGGVGADGSLPPGVSLIGRPGPDDRRYGLGRDWMGPVINYYPPLNELKGSDPTNGDDVP